MQISRPISLALIALALSSLLSSAASAAVAISLTTLGSTYSQNFNTLATTGTANVIPMTGPLAGWALTESGGGTRDDEKYAADDGGSGTGDTFSYGTGTATDRALGGLQSSSLIPIFGALFTNSTGATITSLDIAYVGEEWRLGTASRTDSIVFEYRTGADGSPSADVGLGLTAGTWTGVTALNFSTPVTATTGAKDGNALANRTALSSTISSLSIPDGSSFWIRWTDTNATGADDGLAVDDFTLKTAGVIVAVPEASSFVTMGGIFGLFGLAIAYKRRYS